MHVETPLLRSDVLSSRTGTSVWLKLENQQISGSFKYRGISLLCSKAAEGHCERFISSSGGSAGLAASVAARKLGKEITVVVPQSTGEVTREKLRQEGAVVEVHGRIWDEANLRALELSKAPGFCYIHPFDNPIIWEGHSSMIQEIAEQIGGVVPNAVVVAVGGGGLLCGVVQGMHRVGWKDVPVVAMETIGADSLNACARVGEWVEIDDITSVAKCLGARKVCRRAYELLSEHRIVSRTVPDKEAIRACVGLAADHQIFVIPACGAALSAVYSGVLSQLQQEGRLPSTMANVVVIVCGGSSSGPEKIEEWKREYGL